MNIKVLLITGISAMLTIAQASADAPATEVREVRDTLHGEVVVDPYRWLEGDAEGDVTPEVSAWTDAQNAYTREVLDALPGRDTLEARLADLMAVPVTSTPRLANGRVFYSRREGDQPQALHYYREGANGEETLLLDPRAIDDTGLTAVGWTRPSNDGSKLAFGIYRAGDENYTLHVLDVESGAWFAEEIPGKVRIVRWLPDDSGFYYQRLEELDDPYSAVFKLHRLGTHHRQDPVLFRQRDLSFFYGDSKSEEERKVLAGTWGPGAVVSRDNRWILVTYWTGADSQDAWIASLDGWREGKSLELIPVAIDQRGKIDSAHFAGDGLYLHHSYGAPNGRVSRVDLEQPALEHWSDVVAEDGEKVIADVEYAASRIAVDYLYNASTRIEIFDYSGASHGELELPGIGSAGISADAASDAAFLAFTSFNMPRSIYRVDLRKTQMNLWDRAEVPVDPDSVVVKQVWYPSKDGTEVSMFVVHRKGLTLDGGNPTILTGYGGFGVSRTPGFYATLFPWFENGGVYALPNLRGGGEYGAAWHQAGILENKQNVFDDFVAAAEWLIANGYTSKEQLGIQGGSNGGLLTGAAVTQRPDLFSAVISAVPLLDMLRYQDFLMARYWVPEYGSAEDPAQFPFLRAYSPYHNVEPGLAYPAVLFTAGENDSRVHPMHARKMAALMQASTASDPGEEPILLWVNREAGHGQGKPLHLQIRDIADQRLFMMWQLGMLESDEDQD